MKTRRPDLVVVDKKKITCKIIDFESSGDDMMDMEKEKIEKYQDLRRELQKIWNVIMKIMPTAVGSLDAILRKFGNRLKETGITEEIGQVQKTVSLGTVGILRKVLKT